MPYDPAIHHRRSIRLRGRDYSRPGRYFVTMCVAERHARFGSVVNGRMVLSEAGRIAEACWRAIPEHFPHASLDEWIVMPDHVHGIIVIAAPGPDETTRVVGAKNLSPIAGDAGAKNLSPIAERAKDFSPLPAHGTSRTVGSIVRGFKIGVTKAVGALWQRNYYEIIIRDEAAMRNIRAYIRFNPLNYEVVMNCGEPEFLGNRALLDGPKLGFLASRGEVSPHGCLPLKTGEAIMSGFLSPMERAVFKAGLAHGRPLIWVKPWALTEGVDSFPIRHALDEGRLLILSPFKKCADAPSVRRAAWCNEYVMRHCDRLMIGRLKPGGMLECLLSDAPADLNCVILDAVS